MSRMATRIIPTTQATSFKIPTGQQNSNVLTENQLMGMTASTLFGIATADSATHSYVLQVSNDGGATWFTLNDGTNDVTAPAAGVAFSYPNPPVSAYRIRDKTAVTTADTTWDMVIEVPIYGI